MKRYFFPQIGSLAVLMAALLLPGCSLVSKSTSQTDIEPTPLPTTAALANPIYTVQRGEVVGTVAMTGSITPVDQQSLFFPIDGHVHSVYVNVGDTVKVGTVIADLEGIQDLQQQLQLSQINLQQSQINADIAQQNYNLFVAQTSRRSAGYRSQLTIVKDKLDLANLDVQKASVGIQVLQNTITQNQIISTMAGQVTALQLSTGDQVHAYNSVGTVADISKLEVSASITDFNILNQLEVGMNATIAPSSGLGKPVTGSIRLLPSNSGNAQGSNQNNIIHFSVDSPLADAGYKLSDLVKIIVILMKRENVLWVPPQTIRTFSGRQFVVVQDVNVQRRVDVSVGVIGTDRVEILSGLTEGQVVVSP